MAGVCVTKTPLSALIPRSGDWPTRKASSPAPDPRCRSSTSTTTSTGDLLTNRSLTTRTTVHTFVHIPGVKSRPRTLMGGHERKGPTILARIKRGQVDEATDMLLTQMPSQEEISHQDDRDGDALFWAASRGYTFLVELLLTLGAKVNNRSLASGGTPLHAAADNGNSDIIEILLKWGSDVSARNYFRDTPCHLAAFRGHSECVAALLKAGTNIDLRNSRENTVLDEAKYGQLVMESGQHTLIKHLLYSHQHSPTEKYTQCATKENSKRLDHKDRGQPGTDGDAYCKLKQLTADTSKSNEKHS